MSGGQIDYRIRPAKHIERQMLCDLFRCLSPFGKIENYRYWGFGAIYFTDFALIHKALGISNMLSMERDRGQEKRHNFNRPYKCIQLDFRDSQEVLASIDQWDVRTIAWLDYTDRLNQKILSDIQFFARNICPGSVVVITTNSQPDKLLPGGSISEPGDPSIEEGASGVQQNGRLALLKKNVGLTNVPPDVREKDLGGWGTALVQARIISNAIAEAINSRNSLRSPGTRYIYKQLVNFHYQDNAKMSTVGGVIFQEGDVSKFAECDFSRLEFYRDSTDSYVIEVPLLTPTEKRHLDAGLPLGRGEVLEVEGIPAKEIERYQKVYRYFPTFIVGE